MKLPFVKLLGGGSCCLLELSSVCLRGCPLRRSRSCVFVGVLSVWYVGVVTSGGGVTRHSNSAVIVRHGGTWRQLSRCV